MYYYNLKIDQILKNNGQDEYERGMRKGKRRILTLENIRPNAICMRDIFAGSQGCQETLEWWDSIDAG